MFHWILLHRMEILAPHQCRVVDNHSDNCNYRNIRLADKTLDLRKKSSETNSWICSLARIVTVVLSATVYCVSFLPASAYLAARPYLESETGDENVQYFFRVGDTFKYFNVVANFFIYSLAVISFRDFLKKRMQALIWNVTCTTSASYIGTRADLASDTILRNQGACDILQTDV